MATAANPLTAPQNRPDLLSGTPRAHAIDRWIFVCMAVWFIAIVLTGFVPDSFEKLAAIEAGKRLPFPLVLHFHAVLMGSFLLLLLAQTWLMATGRSALHKQLGVLAVAVAVALIVVGFILVPTNYWLVWNAAQSGPPGLREAMTARLPGLDNTLLLQMRAGALFALFLAIGLAVRSRNAGLHKRMMILATVMPFGAAFSRMHWLPTTLPEHPIGGDLYLLATVSPMFLWDVIRNRRVHEAYWIWLGVCIPVALLVYTAWSTPWWRSIAHQLMGG